MVEIIGKNNTVCLEELHDEIDGLQTTSKKMKKISKLNSIKNTKKNQDSSENEGE